MKLCAPLVSKHVTSRRMLGPSGGGSTRFRKVGFSVPLGTLIREAEKVPESNAAIEKPEYREMWLKSDRTELHKLWDVSTFTPVEVPARHKVIGCMFVRTWKGNELGEVVKPQLRLVGLGYSQIEDVNYFETFSSTPSPSFIKLY